MSNLQEHCSSLDTVTVCGLINDSASIQRSTLIGVWWQFVKRNSVCVLSVHRRRGSSCLVSPQYRGIRPCLLCMSLIEYLFPFIIIFPLEFYLKLVFQNNNISNCLHNFEIFCNAWLEKWGWLGFIHERKYYYLPFCLAGRAISSREMVISV